MDLFLPAEFGWKDIDAVGPYDGVYVNRGLAVAWSQARGIYRCSSDAGNSWSVGITPRLDNRVADKPVLAVATSTAVFVLGSSGFIFDRSGTQCNAVWKIAQCSRLAVTRTDLLACEEGSGLRTQLVRDGAVVQHLPGRIVFAFDGGVVTYDGSSAFASDGAETRQIDVRAASGMPESLPLATGPGGPVMRAADGSMWTYRSTGLTGQPSPTPGLRVLSYGYGDLGSAGIGSALLARSHDGKVFQTINAIRPPSFRLFVDKDASVGLVFHARAVAVAGKDALGYRYLLAGEEGLKLGRLAAPPAPAERQPQVPQDQE